jgi:hypothetical protein
VTLRSRHGADCWSTGFLATADEPGQSVGRGPARQEPWVRPASDGQRALFHPDSSEQEGGLDGADQSGRLGVAGPDLAEDLPALVGPARMGPGGVQSLTRCRAHPRCGSLVLVAGRWSVIGSAERRQRRRLRRPWLDRARRRDIGHASHPEEPSPHDHRLALGRATRSCLLQTARRAGVGWPATRGRPGTVCCAGTGAESPAVTTSAASTTAGS